MVDVHLDKLFGRKFSNLHHIKTENVAYSLTQQFYF